MNPRRPPNESRRGNGRGRPDKSVQNESTDCGDYDYLLSSSVNELDDALRIEP
jgi:hypothetical protein